ncbi:MAG: HAD-IA family hydrolase [Trueperaceae bacterium]|nr:HAD-IA family hydrolase [Trueperaceae bacterium]
MTSSSSSSSASPSTRSSDPTVRRAVVFDLDGTLIDSLPDIVWSFRAAFDAAARPAPSETEVRALIGRPLEEMASQFVTDGAGVTAICDAYRRIYPLHFTERTRPFPGAVEVLTQVRRRGWATAVATTKRTEMATRLVTALGLDAHLDHVQGTDDFPHKPAPDVIHAALAALGAEGSWMVGDTVTDLQAGRAAGLRTYAVSWGTHDARRLAEAEPDALEPDLWRLLELLPGSPA